MAALRGEVARNSRQHGRALGTHSARSRESLNTSGIEEVANWKTVSTHRFDTDAFKDAQPACIKRFCGNSDPAGSTCSD